jgi:peptide/nickel transport system permease protein
MVLNKTTDTEGCKMREYLVKRLVVSLSILWIVATLNFIIFQVVSPISPEDTYLHPDITPEVREQLRELFGLNDPMEIRYLKYIKNMFTWNFGVSFRTRAPVIEEMSWRLPATVLLLGTAMVATILVGVPLGILAASRRGSKLDVATITSGLFTWGVPIFFIQLLALLFLVRYMPEILGFDLFPVSGLYTNPPPENPLVFMADVAWHLALPIMTLVIGSFGGWALYTRNVMLDALTQDYIVTARAKGLSERTVLYRHAFRSTLPPIITIIALSIPGIIGGAVITEWIFSIPGIGRWYLNSMLATDWPVVQAILFIYAVLVIFCNLLADLLYGVLDPRIRVGVRR